MCGKCEKCGKDHKGEQRPRWLKPARGEPRQVMLVCVTCFELVLPDLLKSARKKFDPEKKVESIWRFAMAENRKERPTPLHFSLAAWPLFKKMVTQPCCYCGHHPKPPNPVSLAPSCPMLAFLHKPCWG